MVRGQGNNFFDFVGSQAALTSPTVTPRPLLDCGPETATKELFSLQSVPKYYEQEKFMESQ
jgi:hypothetical protein